MGGVASVPQAPVLSKPKKRRRKPKDLTVLITPRTGRLTDSYWILKEGFVQDVRSEAVGNTRSYFYQKELRLSALVCCGYLEKVTGPKGGRAFRTTSDGAFALLIADGQFEARQQRLEKEKADGVDAA
jgi:hypothetical protein